MASGPDPLSLGWAWLTEAPGGHRRCGHLAQPAVPGPSSTTHQPGCQHPMEKQGWAVGGRPWSQAEHRQTHPGCREGEGGPAGAVQHWFLTEEQRWWQHLLPEQWEWRGRREKGRGGQSGWRVQTDASLGSQVAAKCGSWDGISLPTASSTHPVPGWAWAAGSHTTNTRGASRARGAQNRTEDTVLCREKALRAPPPPWPDLPYNSSFWQGIKACVFLATGHTFPLHGTVGSSPSPLLPSSSTRGIFHHPSL